MVNRFKNFIVTVILSAAFIGGSYLCSVNSQSLDTPTAGSVVLLAVGIAILFIDFLFINIALKLAHEDATVFETISFSSCITFLFYNGTRLVAAPPFLIENPPVSLTNIEYYLGVYMVFFGVSFLYFLIKN